MENLIPITAIAIVAATGALAGGPAPVPADPVVIAPMPVAVATDWSGPYLGVLGGIQRGQLTSIAPTRTISATTYGGFAGYNFQSGDVVYGVEVAAQTGDATINGLAFNVDYLVDGRARLGYAFDNVLVYAAGGYSQTQLTRTTPVVFSGFNVGAGVDVAVSDNFVLGGEYIYRRLTGTSGGTSLTYGTHAVQLRAAYRF